MLHERIKVSVVMQQFVAALDASGRDYQINGLANGNTQPAQHPEVSCGLNCSALAAQVYDRQRRQKLPCSLKFLVLHEPLQNLRQD